MRPADPENGGQPQRSTSSTPNTPLTPMMEQHRRLKAQYPECLLFFRVGDFYELFGDDAVVAAPLLEVQLTSRDGVVPMCGVPHHALHAYVERLLAHGWAVSVADQVEEPGNNRGLLERRVVRVWSPGTFIPDEEQAPAVIGKLPRVAALWQEGPSYGLAVAELASGRLVVAQWTRDRDDRTLRQALDRWRPDELLSHPARPDLPGFARPWPRLRQVPMPPHLGSRRALGLDALPQAQRALDGLLGYLHHTQRGALGHLTRVEIEWPQGQMKFSPGALQALAVLPTAADSPSLFGLINGCRTRMGERRLWEWLARPLTDPLAIAERHTAIRRWVGQPLVRNDAETLLKAVGDCEMRLSRLAVGTGTPRDLVGLCRGLEACRRLREPAAAVGAGAPPAEVWTALDRVLEAAAALHPDPPVGWQEGHLIREGVDPEVDRLRHLLEHSREALLQLEESERQRSGIRAVKIGYHRTFGYYLEVPRKRAEQVPDDWVRRQTMANSERFVSHALRQLEGEILEAEAGAVARERSLAEAVRQQVLDAAPAVQAVANWAAGIDAAVALAQAVERHRWQPVQWSDEEDGRTVAVRAMRHPLMSARLSDYVPSDVELAANERIVILTGPNMGGKSTYMRALAQNVILAQTTGYLCAEAGRLPVFDGLFLRMGAGDDILRGESTFMVEMQETAAILRHAGAHSLVLLDELGRGTSTFDGMALAWAVIEHLAQGVAPVTWFATHYHELTALAERLDSVVNRCAEVVEANRQVVFTHRIVAGPANRSYGVDVARRAGLPAAVVARAQHLLQQWESRETVPLPARGEQITLFAPDPLAEELRAALTQLDPDSLSPREAWEWVAAWHARLVRAPRSSSA